LTVSDGVTTPTVVEDSHHGQVMSVIEKFTHVASLRDTQH